MSQVLENLSIGVVVSAFIFALMLFAFGVVRRGQVGASYRGRNMWVGSYFLILGGAMFYYISWVRMGVMVAAPLSTTFALGFLILGMLYLGSIFWGKDSSRD